MIAVTGLDVAAWGALAKAASVPLAVILRGSLAPIPTYSSNGLWLTPVDALGEQAAAFFAEGGFQGLKLRLGRERPGNGIEWDEDAIERYGLDASVPYTDRWIENGQTGATKPSLLTCC
jgi:mandelate racemase